MMGTVKGEIAYEYLCMKLEHVQRKTFRHCIKSWRVYPCGFHYFTQGRFLKSNLTFQTALIATYPSTLIHSLTSLPSGDPAVLP